MLSTAPSTSTEYTASSTEYTARRDTPGRFSWRRAFWLLLLLSLFLAFHAAYRGHRLAAPQVRLLTDEDFSEQVLTRSDPAMVHFTASWCPSCQAMRRPVGLVAEQFEGRALVGRVDVDRSPDLADRYGVRAVPTTVVIHGGVVVRRVQGVRTAAELAALLDLDTAAEAGEAGDE